MIFMVFSVNFVTRFGLLFGGDALTVQETDNEFAI